MLWQNDVRAGKGSEGSCDDIFLRFVFGILGTSVKSVAATLILGSI
jgi:hypothetical protein